ncbi:N-acetylmuramoyl-L-alanine amidase [Streptosporangium sp. 'caverna']|uniref:peptidoglycan recognition protein family protein n=1 Tax=Streptosporangium sp. 'caverna' TaxID=2202249 RepID=UPI001EF8A260|nr:N-acetylmuramoyl-L-alanine amidase [Streptosporangium sp. 'caverna']
MSRLPGIAVLVALAALIPAAPGATAPGGGKTAFAVPGEAAPGGRQAAFAQAARTYGVPESVLLAVSYLESRWDTNGGLPSVSAGYGPMHLVDAGIKPARHHHYEGGEDPRGDETRPHPLRIPDATAVPPEDTLHRAAELTGLTPGRLREDPAANIRGGAALLADYQRRVGGKPSTDPADWYGAAARYSGSYPGAAGTAARPDAGTGAGPNLGTDGDGGAGAVAGPDADAAGPGESPSDREAADTEAARSFADEVYATIRSGAARVTDDGERVVLPAMPALSPRRPPAGRTAQRRGAPAPAAAPAPDCPPTVSCEWIPAAYKQLPGGGYGNHDRYDKPRKIDYIVIHDGETSYNVMTRLAKNPSYLSWHFTLRSSDGHIAQHLRANDIGWHAGNWYVNSRSIGLEHEGYLAKGGAWYTEAMYLASARLVSYLAKKYDVPLNRAHIIGHDNVPGTTPETVGGMHEDPGPYWNWSHYFDLLGNPLKVADSFKLLGTPQKDPKDQGDQETQEAQGTQKAQETQEAQESQKDQEAQGGQGARNGQADRKGAAARSVLIRPDYALNRPGFTGCTGGCRRLGATSVWLHTRPALDAPLVKDIGKHPTGGSSYSVYDHAARASTGQRYALAGRKGDWTAIWYLGQKAWFNDPVAAPTSVPVSGRLVTPKPGLRSVKLYGRAYPEASAYPRGVPAQALTPLQYSLPAGQLYSLGLTTRGAYLRTATFDPSSHRVIRGDIRYHQIQFGHRFMFVRASDVQVLDK